MTTRAKLALLLVGKTLFAHTPHTPTERMAAFLVRPPFCGTLLRTSCFTHF